VAATTTRGLDVPGIPPDIYRLHIPREIEGIEG